MRLKLGYFLGRGECEADFASNLRGSLAIELLLHDDPVFIHQMVIEAANRTSRNVKLPPERIAKDRLCDLEDSMDFIQGSLEID